MRRTGFLWALLALVSVTACAPTVAPAATTRGAPEQAPARVAEATRPQPVLSVVCRSEPLSAINSTSNRSAIVVALFSAFLGGYDARETPYPILAEALPSLNTSSWVLLPDGKMETTYRLRANLRWHDGTPLTAEDFHFGWRVQTAGIESGMFQNSEYMRQIEDILTPDSRTVVIRWKGLYGEAQVPDLAPRPRHILEPVLAAGVSEALNSHAYWFGEHVGAGPYKLEKWEPGAFIEATAFDGYALGRPKIDRVRVTWSSDPNATLARLLAGDTHVALDDALQFQQALTLRRDWRDGAPMILIPNRLRYLQVQARAEYAKPAALLDARVRKAVTHAIDRKTLADVLLEGEGMVADTIMPPTVGYYPEVERAITKYAYDVRRTEQLLGEAGFTKDRDGFFANASTGRFNPEVQGTAEGQEGQETTIVVDFLRRAGIDAELSLLTAAQRDASDELKATYPGFSSNNATLSRDPGLNKFHTLSLATPANRWSGSNKMGWSNPEFDRLRDAWGAALETAERDRILIQIAKLISEEAPIVPLYFNFAIVAHVNTLAGPQVRAPGGTHHANVHEWSWK